MSSVSPPNANCLDAIDVFVLAAGPGTRIRPVLGDTPKLLAPIGGHTYLDHLLNWLHGFGARHVVLGLGVHARTIIDYAQKHPIAGMEIATVVEPSPLGTAGAIDTADQAQRAVNALEVRHSRLFTFSHVSTAYRQAVPSLPALALNRPKQILVVLAFLRIQLAQSHELSLAPLFRAWTAKIGAADNAI